ncbi:MAG: type VI secretion system tube protein Hcp, partial [Succinivibrio sp.]|nr:type VI secretion system tube protein Hcp [Succinivibrio sp.]
MALDFYVQINGIDGQSNDKGHSKWIEAIAFSHGSKQQIASERATAVAGRGTFEPFIFVHEIDKATPKLQQFCMSGQKIDKVKVEVCSAVAGVQTPVYEVTLEQVKVISAKVQAG